MRANFGDTHVNTLIAVNNLASLLQSEGKLSEAESIFRESLMKLRMPLGDMHPESFTFINNLAGLLQAQKKYAEAEPLFRCAGR